MSGISLTIGDQPDLMVDVGIQNDNDAETNDVILCTQDAIPIEAETSLSEEIPAGTITIQYSGYYIPSVDAAGILSWRPSNPAMPDIPSASLVEAAADAVSADAKNQISQMALEKSEELSTQANSLTTEFNDNAEAKIGEVTVLATAASESCEKAQTAQQEAATAQTAAEEASSEAKSMLASCVEARDASKQNADGAAQSAKDASASAGEAARIVADLTVCTEEEIVALFE